MSHNGLKGSNKYGSSNVTITGGPGLMYNEATRAQTPTSYKSAQYQNNNSYMVTVAKPKSKYVRRRKAKSR